jgi:low molecular weight protein-tyrosine phosphatase
MVVKEDAVSSRDVISSDLFQILFICSGNRCRSPLAEVFVRQISSGLPVEVHSAGTLELGSVAAAPEMLPVAERFGLDLSAHRSAPLSAIAPPYPDLILGLERVHAAAAVVEARLPAERVFTLIEMVRLLEGIAPPDESDPVERARSAVALAHQARRTSPAFVPGEDIADPFGGPTNGYVEMTLQVRELCTRLLIGLFGTNALR